LARAASFAATQEPCAGQEYFIVDQGGLKTSTWVALLASALGKKTVSFLLPWAALKAAARLAGSGSQAAGRLARSFPFLQPEIFSCTVSKVRVSSRKIQSLGFSLLHPDPAEALPACVHNLVKQGSP
jgi:hypothetical protein